MASSASDFQLPANARPPATIHLRPPSFQPPSPGTVDLTRKQGRQQGRQPGPSGIGRRGLSRQELALIGITMLWGATFSVVHLAMQVSGPMFFVGLRFIAAGLIGLFVFRRAMAGLTALELRAGIAIGLMLLGGYGLQTVGLQTITGSESAFITALYVPLVPLLQWLVLKRPVHPMNLVGIVLAFIGLLCLAGPGPGGGFSFGSGQLVTLLGAFAIAGEIILISRYAGRVDIGRVTTVQLLVCGLAAFALMPLIGEPVPAFSRVWLLAALSLGAMSILIQVTMNWAQRSVSATRATIIYAGEPVWGGVVGRLLGDRLPALAFFGAALILLGMLVSELRPRRSRER